MDDRELSKQSMVPDNEPLEPSPPLDPHQVGLPDDASMGLSEPVGHPPEPDHEHHKRAGSEPTESRWEHLPPTKRSRLELVELLHTRLIAKSKAKNGKRKECHIRDFHGRDSERLKQAIHKEINNNLQRVPTRFCPRSSLSGGEKIKQIRS